MMNNSPLVSVIIPIFNVFPYLTRCLDSVTKQTYKNLEIILIDDGSTDNGSELCDKYASKDSRIHVIHQTNQGLSAARNSGLRVANGTFILFIDGDDSLSLSAVDLFVKTAQDTKADVVWSDFVYIDDNEKIQYPPLPPNVKKEGISLLTTDEFLFNLFARKEGSVCYKLYRRELMENIFFDDSIRRVEDVPFLMAISPRISSVAFLPEPLYFYYMRTNSICHTRPEKISSISQTLLIYKHAYSLCKKNGFQKASSPALAWWLHETSICAAACILFDLDNQSESLLEQMRKDLLSHKTALFNNCYIPNLSRLFGVMFLCFPHLLKKICRLPRLNKYLRAKFMYRAVFYRPIR